MSNEEEPSGEPWVSSENRETQSAQQTWVELETILEAVPAETVQKVAAALAMTYNDVDSLGPPPSLLRLRIALRERSCEQAQEPVQEAETDQGQDQDDMRSWTKTEAAVVDDTVAGRRQEAETEPGPAGSRDLEVGVQTSPRRRQGKVPHRKFKTRRAQMERELGAAGAVAGGGDRAGARHVQHQTGARRRVAAEEE